MHLWEAVNNEKIKIILNKQEGNAVYMADGYARVKKCPAVVLATAGPGATNMVTGLATALMDSVPIIAIGATVSTSSFGRNPVQDGSGRGQSIEQRLVFKACCKQAMLAPSPDAVPNMVREAFRLANSGRKGPVYIEIPSDFWNVEIDYEKIQPCKYKNLNSPSCSKSDSVKIAEKLYQAKHPLLVIGEGADEQNIKKKLPQILQKLAIPYTVSPLAKNFIDEYDKLFLGVIRQEGKTQKVYEYMKKSDLILFLGDRMQEWEMAWYDRSIFGDVVLAQVDPDYSEIGRVYPVDISAIGSVLSFFSNFELKEHDFSKILIKEVVQLNINYPRKKRYPDGDGVNPLNVNNIVEDLVTDNSIIVCDTGYAKSMAIVKFRTKLTQQFLTADKNGPMGYSVPAAIGAALASKKEVICFVGDGGFQMSLNELGTAMNYDIKVIFVIENNSGCMSIVDYHKSIYGHDCADTFINPDYVKIAHAYKMKGYKLDSKEEFEKAFKLAQKEELSVIIDVKIDQSLMIWE